MNVLTVNKTHNLSGRVTPPSSKSQSVRALLIALLSQGRSTLSNLLDAEDIRDALRVCTQLGAHISMEGKNAVVHSEGAPIQTSNTVIHSGNSGITTLFVMPMLGLRKNSHQPIILDCGEQMRARPVYHLVDALRNLGLEIHYAAKKNSLPISISGRLVGGKTEVDGSTSSQYLSALLLSLPCAIHDSEIVVDDLKERPYMEMTLRCLNQHNIVYKHNREAHRDIFYIKGNQQYRNFETIIPGDFSSASYLIAASVVTDSTIEIHGLDMNDAQGDKQLLFILQQMGADIVINNSCITIRGGKLLRGLRIDGQDIPDLLPILAVIGAYAEGNTEIYNVEHARIKETDRIHSMCEGLSRMGAKVEKTTTGLTVYQSPLRAAHLRGYGDHRTVMALSIAGLSAEGTTTIEDPEAMHKTFPEFVHTMQSLGANMEVKHGN